MDVFIVMPFYKIHMNVEAKLEELDKQRDAGLLPLKKQNKFVKSKEKNNEKITAEQR
jgi:cellobiose-specific PTS